jgi:N-acetylneuraminic acid mutarotase
MLAVFCVVLIPAAAQNVVWTKKGRMPMSSRNGAAVTTGDRIFYMGGSGSRLKNLEYNPLADTWKRKKNMITEGWNIALAYLDGKIHVFGGDLFKDRAEVYDRGQDSWKKLKAMPTPRQHLKCGVVEGRIYVFGGLEKGSLGSGDSYKDWDGKAHVSSKNERYDPVTDTWREMAPLPVAMHSPNAFVVVIGRSVYVMGGMGDKKSIWTDLKTLEVYDTKTNTWKLRKDLPFAFFAGAAVIKDKLYAVGANKNLKGKLSRYDSGNDSWKILADIPVVRFQAGMVANNMSIYMMGGNDENFTPYADVYEILTK